jgi:hypothetical protein
LLGVEPCVLGSSKKKKKKKKKKTQKKTTSLTPPSPTPQPTLRALHRPTGVVCSRAGVVALQTCGCRERSLRHSLAHTLGAAHWYVMLQATFFFFFFFSPDNSRSPVPCFDGVYAVIAVMYTIYYIALNHGNLSTFSQTTTRISAPSLISTTSMISTIASPRCARRITLATPLTRRRFTSSGPNSGSRIWPSSASPCLRPPGRGAWSRVFLY